MTAKYRDLSHLTAFLVQLWMYATPIIYPLSEIPERWRWVAALNPMTAPIECLKRMFLGVGVIDGSQLAFSVGATLALLISGVWVFRRVERTVVDTV